MKKFITSAILFCTCLLAVAQPPQDKTQLEKERQEIQRELKEIQGIYNKVKGESKITLGQLSVLNKKINLQERYIGSINKELKMIDDDLYLSNLEIFRLQKQLDTLKTEYARTVVYAYKNRSSYDYLNFLFSASSFNDAVKRVTYLKSYRTYREKQVNTILETQQLIAKRKQQQLGRKEQKNVALQNQTKEKSVLDVQKREKDAVLGGLKSKEKDLKKQITAKQKKDRDLNNAITAIIRRQIKAAEEEAKAKALADKKRLDDEAKRNAPVATTPTTTAPTTNNPTTVAAPVTTSRTAAPAAKKSYLDLNANDVKLNSTFSANKGMLPWPVDNGYVSIHFGRYKIENTLIEGDNPGITISTQPGATVKSVFTGEVVGVYNIGDGMVVTVRHGKYFTTYSNLSSASVKRGDTVNKGDTIGRAGRDDEGTGGQIDFLLMIETNNVNPEPWLRR